MECRVSFTLVLTVLTLILSLIPSIVIWVVFVDLLSSSVDLLKSTTDESTDSMAGGTQELLLSQAMEKFDAILTEGENEMAVWKSQMEVLGLLAYDLRPSRFNVRTQFLLPFENYPFVSMKGHSLFSTLAISSAILSNGVIGTQASLLSFSTTFMDVSTNSTGNRTLYLTTMALSPDETNAQCNLSYVNQVTGVPTIPAVSTILPLTLRFLPSGWNTSLSFSPYTGEALLTRWQWQAAQNSTWIQVSLSMSTTALSKELLALLSDVPNDRLALLFRQKHGYMIAASHGKYWSDSDIGIQFVDVRTGLLDVSAYQQWTCLQSTDALIRQACQWLYGTYQSWTSIPVLREERVLGSQRYWVATEISNTSSLPCTAIMLKNRASVMGAIDAGNTQVDGRVSDRKSVTIIIIGCVSAIAVILPVAVGLWLASRLYSLATAMDRIAKLQFNGNTIKPTPFQELHRFQTSFIQMERGLQAFGKFVPQAVVKVLIAGQMKANDEMNPETLTIMFADIEGFSTVCENVTPQVLVAVCTEYFEAMCNNIVQRNGTIDKFIGDCIMALWNAPERLPGHERDAVAASLAMQASVMELQPSWQQQGLPVLKFRLGVHTGVCLVGNFGCSYRVSYTCLGDGVNLSARLEALNKKFGTFICVSHATYQACFNDFHFRRLAKVTVPGKAEVLPVYEVLCEVDEATRTKLCCPKEIDAPGTINAGEPSRMSLNSVHGSGYVHVLNDPSHDGSTGRKLNHPDANQNQVPYHWAYVDRTQLLRQAREYEEAYQAMVAGDQARARQLLRSKPTMDVADKSWASLGAQLEHTEAGQPWDGVFYFHEK